MKIKKERAIRLFEALGFKTASQWDPKKLKTKLKNLPDLVEDGFELDKPKLQILLSKVLSAANSNKKITVIENKDQSNLERTQDKMANKKSKKRKKDAKKVASKTSKKDEKKTTKKETKVAKKKVSKKKVGVIATILETIQTKGPISKDGILKALVRQFPDREEESMKKTINVQVPSRLNSDKGANVKKNDKGKYFIK